MVSIRLLIDVSSYFQREERNIWYRDKLGVAFLDIFLVKSIRFPSSREAGLEARTVNYNRWIHTLPYSSLQLKHRCVGRKGWAGGVSCVALLSCSKLTAQSSGARYWASGYHSHHISLLHKMTATMMPSAAKPAGCFKRSNELVTILCLFVCLNSLVLFTLLSHSSETRWLILQ